MPATPTTVESLQTELAVIFAAVGLLAEECFGSGAGRRMLNLAPDAVGFSYQQVDVRKTLLGKMLPVWHAYAFEGVVMAGFDIQYWEPGDGLLERLSDLIGLLRVEDGFIEDCLDTVSATWSGSREIGHLSNLQDLLEARLSLDKGYPLTLKELALLADMNERSVRNAVHADGSSRLTLEADEKVSNAEAMRWLAGRRNFKPTTWRKLAANLGEQPDTLLGPEIPGFVAQRLSSVEESWGDYSLKATLEDALYFEAKRRCGLSVERLKAATKLPFDIHPDECPSLAKLLEVDVGWFTHQVMYALYPEQMDIIMNPRNWSSPAISPSEPTAAQQSVVVELSESMLTHGYLDMPIEAAGLFPGYDFGSKGTGLEGTQVELRFGGHTAMTDIRMKSSKTIAPRKRFTGWFASELRAKPGDRIQVDKISEGVYTLTYLPT